MIWIPCYEESKRPPKKQQVVTAKIEFQKRRILLTLLTFELRKKKCASAYPNGTFGILFILRLWTHWLSLFGGRERSKKNTIFWKKCANWGKMCGKTLIFFRVLNLKNTICFNLSHIKIPTGESTGLITLDIFIEYMPFK